MLLRKLFLLIKVSAKDDVKYEGDITKLKDDSFINWNYVFNRSNVRASIYDKSWYDDDQEKKEELRAKVMAEALIPNEIHKDKIKFIYCQNNDIKQEVMTIAKNFGTNAVIKSNCSDCNAIFKWKKKSNFNEIFKW